MKRFAAIISLAVGLLITGSTSVAAVDTDNFTISHYNIDYTLSRDADNRSILHTKETITAQFPDYDQNHGIERYIPIFYDIHPLSTRVLSVTDARGGAIPYTTYTSGEYEVVRIGNADRYVHGAQTYVLEYTQRDVTKFFADKSVDEFYWDTNGTEWRVPIDSLSVTLTLDHTLQEALSGNSACYVGLYGASEQCELTEVDGVFQLQAEQLPRGGNATVAIGFRQGTFAEYQQSTWDYLFGWWLVIQILLVPVTLVAIVLLTIRYYRWSSRKKEVGTIVPEYIPPKGVSIQVANSLILGSATAFSAQLIDFAVRHYIKVIEEKPAGLWSSAVYRFEIIRPVDDLTAEEQELLTDLFNKRPEAGATITTKEIQDDDTLPGRLTDNPSKLKKLLRGAYALQVKDEQKSAWFRRVAIWSGIGAILLVSPALLFMTVLASAMGAILWPLSDKGLDLYRYVQGLKMYISVAEKERLKVLQSTTGAQKVVIDSGDNGQLVKLYERLLPYAILFGQEKSWNKELGKYYESAGLQPDWYTGASLATFNAVAFSGAVTSLTSSINSTGVSYSSSSGSSGGGSSGGGGGGGGGGGW